MDLLTAVNRILPKLGEHPVTSTTIKHPTLAVILPQIDAKLEDTLTPGWWFNQFKQKLYPDSEGNIALPDDTLSFVPFYEYAVVRGKRLYNSETLDYKWTQPVEGTWTQLVQFDELPESAAQYVFYSALVAAYVTDIGLSDEVKLWQGEVQDAYKRMTAEHLRNKRYSIRKSRRYQGILCALRG